MRWQLYVAAGWAASREPLGSSPTLYICLKKIVDILQFFHMAGEVGLEPTTNGFGDRDSTN